MTSSGDNPSQPTSDQNDPAIPHALAAELARLSSPGRLAVPPGFDDDILGMARARLRPLPVSRLLFRVGTGLAAAAALGLVVWLAGVWPSGRAGTRGVALAALDPGKHIDIVDAFSLARQLRAGQTPDSSWDVTADGTIDQQDVDWLKAMAVRLTSSGGASGTGGGGT